MIYEDVKVVCAMIIVFSLVSYFYYLEIYGAVLAAVYGMGVAEVFDRTFFGFKVREFIRGRWKD